jgi:hypothetical protein
MTDTGISKLPFLVQKHFSSCQTYFEIGCKTMHISENEENMVNNTGCVVADLTMFHWQAVHLFLEGTDCCFTCHELSVHNYSVSLFMNNHILPEIQKQKAKTITKKG